MDKKIRFGIIGCSSISKKNMLSAINDSSFAEIGMIGSRSPEKALEFCKKFNCRYSGSYNDILKNGEIDAVYISLPTGLHEEWTVKAAEAGKHILCEKSSTTSLESAKRMVSACKKNNVRLLENFMFKHHPQHKEVMGLIQNGFLGKLLKFHGCFSSPLPDSSSIRINKDLGGGVLNEAACYPIYASRMLFSEEPIGVVCNLKTDATLNVDVGADIMLFYPNEKVAFVSAEFGAYFQSTYTLLGTKAKLSMKRAYAVPKEMETSIFLEFNDKTKEIIVSPEDHFRLIIDAFCQEVISGTNTNDFESDLLAQARVLEAARLSNREERLVKINELK